MNIRPTPAHQKVARDERSEREWERRLVLRMVSGEEAAFDEFAEEYLPRLYRFAVSRMRRDADSELARDIVQTTLCKVMPKIGSFRGDSSLFTWLCTCCRNEMLMYFRKTENQQVHLEWDDVDEHSLGSDAVARGGFGAEPDPHQGFAICERSQLVHDALDNLPKRYASALEWKYLEHVSVDEIATRLECGLKAAESLLTRARDAFRKTYSSLLEVPQKVPFVDQAATLRGTQRMP